MVNKKVEDAARSIALYCRVSTDEQAREGVSLSEQEDRLKAYCRAMGWDASILLFIDDGFSAKDTKRPKLTSLLHAVENGEISKIIVTKLDRMSRRLLDLLQLIDMFQNNNVSFISISESFDTNTPSGRLTLQVLGAVAEFERERIRERVFDNMYHAASNGKWLTQSPYGYRLIDKVLVIHKEEAKIVQEVFDLYLHKGKGFYAIAKHLNEQGIPSKFNKEWSLRTIKLMLTNPVYKGTLVWNRKDSSKKTRLDKDENDWVIVDDALPAVIDKDIWEQVQKKASKKQMASKAQTSPHLLGGLIKCGICGSGMSIGYSGSKNNRYRVYRCSAYKNKGTCISKQFKANEVEYLFKQGLFQLIEINSTSFLITIKEKHKSFDPISNEQKIRTANARYKRKVEAYTAGLIDLADLKEEKMRLDEMIQTTKRNQNKECVNLQELEEKINNLNFKDACDSLPVPELKSLLKTIINKVIIKGEREIDIILNHFEN